MNDKIKEYFEGFGEINSMEILERDHIQYGLIEFKKAEAAETVLRTENHCIEGCNIEARAAVAWHQPHHILNALDDYCMHEIFSNLNLVDLTNAANVCVRFNQQAKELFSAKYKRLDLTECSIENAKNSIQAFGSLAHAIDIEEFPPTISIYESTEYGDVLDESENNSEILSMIDSCCTSALNEVKLIEFDFEDTRYDKVIHDSAFSTLKKLAFYNCQLTSNVKGLLALCNELKALEFYKCSWSYEDICVSKYKNLEELRLVKRTEFDDRTFRKFITLNPTLLRLSFIELSDRDISVSKTLYSIAQKLPNLLELEFQYCSYCNDFVKNLPHLAKLTSLKVLKIDLITITAKQLSDLLTANDTPIEHLKLNFDKIDKDAIESISKMKKLKILELCDTEFTDNDLMELAKGLGHQLEKLRLSNSTAKNLTMIGLKKMLPFATKLSYFTMNSETITIDLDDYRTMLDVVKKRAEKRSLLFELTGQIYVPKTILLENCDILNFKEINKTSITEFSDNDSSPSYSSFDSDPYYNYDYDNYYFDSD